VYEVTLLARTGVIPSRASMDLDVYLLTADGLTAANAVGSASVQRMVHTLYTLLAPTGACLGTVTFFDLPTWARDRFSVGLSADEDGPCSGVSQLYALSQPGRAAVPIFLVESLVTSESQIVLGKDGTIPGPATVGGTVFSGAVVTAADLSAGTCNGDRSYTACGADRVAYIAAHEVGHYLGLFHVSESTGTYFDPLSDTPKCECQSCADLAERDACEDADPTADPPTQVRNADCASQTCGGGDNLMFWSFDGSPSAGKLTGQQGTVLRTSPALR
jgi:hypothetical protein